LACLASSPIDNFSIISLLYIIRPVPRYRSRAKMEIFGSRIYLV
jgi:hypothetical protein